MDQEKQDEILTAKIKDAFALAEKKQYPKFVGFLDERQKAIADRIGKRSVGRYAFFGGYEEAQRAVLGVFPDYLPPDPLEFPVSSITFSYRTSDTLSHRDFLGSLLALGFNREVLGDILVGSGRAVVFLLDHQAEHILSQVEKIGRVGVEGNMGFQPPLPGGRGFLDIEDTVPSSRLDAVIACALRISRGKASDLIALGAVLQNYETVTKTDAQVAEGDVFSVRGYGKYNLEEFGRTTKKGRKWVHIKKYL